MGDQKPWSANLQPHVGFALTFCKKYLDEKNRDKEIWREMLKVEERKYSYENVVRLSAARIE